MEYIVKTIDNASDIELMEKAMIDQYVWNKAYMPEAFARLALLKGKGLLFKLYCYESAPFARYKHYGDKVWCDSCLEFFVSPNVNSPYYINIETNANGAFLIGKRTCRTDSTDVVTLAELPLITATRKENLWTVEGLLTFDFINALFGKTEFKSGTVFKGNFYKCGDETAIAHFGSWSPIDLPKPDFHQSAFFGKFIVE